MARPTGRREGEASRSAAPPTAVVAGEPGRAWFGRLRPGPSAHTRAEAQALVEQIARLLLDTPTKEWRLSEAVGLVAGYLGADAGLLSEVTPDRLTLTTSAQWRDPGVTNWAKVPDELPLTEFPWLAENLDRIEKPFVVPRLAELPATADMARGVLTAIGVRAFGLVPLRREQRVEALLFVFWRGGDARVPARERLEPLGMVADTLLSALARRSVEIELRNQESRFTAVLRESPDVVVLYGEDGTVEFASGALRRITGVEPEQFDFERAPEYVHPDDLIELCTRYGEVLAAPRLTVPLNLRVRGVAGDWRHLEGTLTNLSDEPSVRGVVFNARDVTDRVGLEAELLQAQKMAALGRMAGSVAHDFRNLTFGIRSFAELAIDHAERGRDLMHELQEIVQGCMHADALVSQLLSFGQATTARATVIEPSAALDDVRPVLARLVPPSVSFEVRAEPPLPTVAISGTQLEQILVNLVTNAVEAMPDGGRLAVVVDATDDGLRILVSDNGVGMDEAIRSQVFEPFFTTKPKSADSDGSGTGLGLSIVYAVTTAAGGSVTVDSAPGEGTLVRVFLPAADA
jgi:PAS domain S-box-containing protein